MIATELTPGSEWFQQLANEENILLIFAEIQWRDTLVLFMRPDKKLKVGITNQK